LGQLHLFVAAFLISAAYSLKISYRTSDFSDHARETKSSNAMPAKFDLEKRKVVPPFEALACPTHLSPSQIRENNDGEHGSVQQARLELENGEEGATVFWLDVQSGEEIFVLSLAPHEQTRIDTIVGNRFFVRNAEDLSTVLLDVTMGVHHVHIPNSMADCVSTTGLGGVAREKPPPGALDDQSSVRGWTNESPCDLLASWVWPNGTERWMADLLANEWTPHFEITYMTHDFVFRLTDGRLVKKFTVAPTKIPVCPKIASSISDVIFVEATDEDHATVNSNATNPSSSFTCAAHLSVANSAKELASF